MPAARPRDHGSGQKSEWEIAGRKDLSGCAGGAQAPVAVEPWAPTQHRRDPPRPAAAHPGPAAAAPPRPRLPAAAACPPGPGSPAAAPPAAPQPDGPLPARKQG